MLQFCLALPGSQQCYKPFINYIQRLHVKSFILGGRDLSFVLPGSRFAGMKFSHVMRWKSYLMYAYKKKLKENVLKSKQIPSGKLSLRALIKFVSPCNDRMNSGWTGWNFIPADRQILSTPSIRSIHVSVILLYCVRKIALIVSKFFTSKIVGYII